MMMDDSALSSPLQQYLCHIRTVWDDEGLRVKKYGQGLDKNLASSRNQTCDPLIEVGSNGEPSAEAVFY